MPHRNYIFVIYFAIIIFFVSGCKTTQKTGKQLPKVAEKEVNTANQEGNTVDYDEAVKRHFAMQSKRTQRMMVRSDKKGKRNNTGRNRTWYDRLFNNSCLKSSCMVKTGHTYVTVTKSNSCFLKN